MLKQEIPDNASIFLSGNRPLVAVLKNALGRSSSGFVNDVKKYVEQHEYGDKKIPRHHVIIFDEAQRAWDEDKVQRGSIMGKSRVVNQICLFLWPTEYQIGQLLLD